MTTIRVTRSAERLMFSWPRVLSSAFLMLVLVSFGCARKSESTQPAATEGAKAADNRLKVGFVAAHPIPQVLRNINAFALGARSVNPNATVTVVWTNNWYDPPTEAEAANSLIDLGADVLTMHQDSPITVVQTAEKRGVYSIGYHADLHQFAPKGWLTGAMWDWGPLYLQIARSVKAGTWKSDQYRAGMESGAVKIAP